MKVVYTTNLQAIEPKVACPVIKFLFLLWIRLADSSLATSHFSRFAHTAFCDLHKGGNPARAGRNSLALGPLTVAGVGQCSSYIRPAAAMQADFSSDAGWLALAKGFDKYKTWFSFSYFQRGKTTCLKMVVSWIFTCSSALCLYPLQNAVVGGSSGFPPHFLRADKILKLQMQVLGNPRYPKVSLHLSKKTVNASRKTKSFT